MRYLVGALALVGLTLAACASDRSDIEEDGTAEARSAAAKHDMSGVAAHAQPANDDAKTHVSNANGPNDTTRPQTDPWLPSPVDSSSGVRERPQTDPWRPRPGDPDAVR